MTRTSTIAVAATLTCSLAAGQGQRTQSESKSAGHAVFTPSAIKWIDGPASIPKGSKMAVLEGDPAQEGIFTIRLQLPDGYRIPPHWHPAFEHVTVMSGTFQIGMGEKFDAARLHDVPTGGFTYMAPGMRHFAAAKGDTTVQLHGMGPWQLYYVNPADDPRGTKAP
jgi:quercetin dioxygenase-like cupin family protein